MKTALIALALSALSSAAFGADLPKQFADVCASPAIKSEKLSAACKANDMPDGIKSGERFKAVGIGAELNALAANLQFFVKS